MPGLQTEGFRAQLPLVPTIPENLGKVDVKSIYDRVVQGLHTGDAIRTEQARQGIENDQLKLQQQQAQAGQAVLPSATAAQIGQSNVLASQNSPAVALKSGALASDRLDTLLADTGFQNSLTPQQRTILAQKGVPLSTVSGVMRNPDNTTVSKTETTAALPGDAPVAINTDTTTTPTTPVVTQIPGANGTISPGTVISNTGPGGKTTTEVIHTPIGAYNGIVAATERRVIGTDHDEQGNAIDIVQNFQRSPTGEFHPVGEPTKIQSGSDPSVIRPVGAPAGQPQAFISKDAGKAIEEAQGEIQTLQQRKLELGNIQNAAEQYIGSTAGAGKFTGPIRSFLGDSEAQKFTGSVQNALQTALQPLRGTGRVSQTEFNQALSALPTINDQADTIRAKLGYLNYVTDWAQARQQAYLDNLGKGLNRYQAFQAALKSTPLPEAPNFASGETGSYTQPVAPVPQPAGAHPQDDAAIAYAKSHPEDPRSAAILKANGL